MRAATRPFSSNQVLAHFGLPWRFLVHGKTILQLTLERKVPDFEEVNLIFMI